MYFTGGMRRLPRGLVEVDDIRAVSVDACKVSERWEERPEDKHSCRTHGVPLLLLSGSQGDEGGESAGSTD